jgi:hydrogenase nickel incorporation protein HypB
MCDTCGCDDEKALKESKTVEVNQSILRANEDLAVKNRDLFDKKGILALNLISSPGSGKTTLLEKTIEALKDDISIGVLEGDIETEIDAERIRKKGVPAIQLTTGGACHLEASLVHKGFHELEHHTDGKKLDILFIENVGNLVCPSFFNIGEHIRTVLVSVPEGPDKPLKYPKAFRTSNIFIITKSDLALSINQRLKIFVTSSKTCEGLSEWFEFLRKEKFD